MERGKGFKQSVPLIWGDYVMGSFSLTQYLEVYQILVSPRVGVQRWLGQGVPSREDERGAAFFNELLFLVGAG